jgi:hypothetical protein
MKLTDADIELRDEIIYLLEHDGNDKRARALLALHKGDARARRTPPSFH